MPPELGLWNTHQDAQQVERPQEGCSPGVHQRALELPLARSNKGHMTHRFRVWSHIRNGLLCLEDNWQSSFLPYM